MARKKSNNSLDIEELSYECHEEDNGFNADVICGTPIASFSFGFENEPMDLSFEKCVQPSSPIHPSKDNSPNFIPDNRVAN